MCFPSQARASVAPPAPPPPTPPPPEPPKPLPEPMKLDDKTKPNTTYGKKKSTDVRAKKGTDSLRIPLNAPNTGGQSGGLNV